MRTHLACLGVAAALGLAAPTAHAQYYNPPQSYYSPQPQVVRVAPDMCGGYFYCTNGCTWYGPSYNVYPPFPPFQGVTPGFGKPGLPPCPTPYQFAAQQQGGKQAAFPMNPFTRSPRDYFMWTEAQQERYTREQRPPFVP